MSASYFTLEFLTVKRRSQILHQNVVVATISLLPLSQAILPTYSQTFLTGLDMSVDLVENNVNFLFLISCIRRSKLKQSEAGG